LNLYNITKHRWKLFCFTHLTDWNSLPPMELAPADDRTPVWRRAMR